MIITKKLFFIIALGFGINIQLCASENTSDINLLDFATSLKKVENAKSKNIAAWIEETFWRRDKHSKDVTNQLEQIVQSNRSTKEKKEAIDQIWTQETASTGYFANISTFAKAAAAVIITASIVSYFYFMRPWGSTTK